MVQLSALLSEFPVVQAALSGYSDLPMRRIARRHGVDYALNEVILDMLVTQKGKTRTRILKVAADDHPVGGQLMGSQPEQFAAAAADMVDAGYDLIDINFGCPVKKVLGRCRGGFLLSQPREAVEIIRAVKEAVANRRPVTVKMRRGMDDTAESERHFFAILDGAFALGVSAVTVHGRTVKQRYLGASHWPFLAKVKRHVGDRIVLGSGDLFSADDVKRMLEETGVNGVTVARGCIGNPWIFRDCRRLLSVGELPPPPTIAEQGETIAAHWTECVAEYGEVKAPQIMRKFGIKYSELHPGGLAVRDAFIRVKTAGEFQAVLDRWYDPRGEYPPVQRKSSPGDLVAAGALL